MAADAAERDREAIGDLLARLLPAEGLVVEIASGDGAHAWALAKRFPKLTWQPTERDETALAPLAAGHDEHAPTNLLRPIALDVGTMPWPVAKADAIICIDSLHVMPWDSVLALFGGAARALPSGGLLFLRAPFRFHGKYSSPANEELDQTLRARDHTTGLRDIRELTVAGTRTGIGLEHTYAMSPTHHALVFRRRALLPPTGQFRVG